MRYRLIVHLFTAGVALVMGLTSPIAFAIHDSPLVCSCYLFSSPDANGNPVYRPICKDVPPWFK
jgi:hypothetical protein